MKDSPHLKKARTKGFKSFDINVNEAAGKSTNLQQFLLQRKMMPKQMQQNLYLETDVGRINQNHVEQMAMRKNNRS